MPSTLTSPPVTATAHAVRELVSPRENTEAIAGPIDLEKDLHAAPCGAEFSSPRNHDRHVMDCGGCRDVALAEEAADFAWMLTSSYL